MSPSERSAVREMLDEIMATYSETDEIAALLAAELPRLVDRRCAHSLVEGAYDTAARRELDSALPMDTGPFVRMDP